MDYTITVDGKSYRMHSDKPLSDAEMQQVASQYAGKSTGEGWSQRAIKKTLAAPKKSISAQDYGGASPYAGKGYEELRKIASQRGMSPELGKALKAAAAKEGVPTIHPKEGTLNDYKQVTGPLANVAGAVYDATSMFPKDKTGHRLGYAAVHSTVEESDPRILIAGELPARALGSLVGAGAKKLGSTLGKKAVQTAETVHPNIQAARDAQSALKADMQAGRPALRVVEGGEPGVEFRPDTGKGRVKEGHRTGAQNSTGHITTEDTLASDLQASIDALKAKNTIKRSKQSGSTSLLGPRLTKTEGAAAKEQLKGVAKGLSGVSRTMQTIGDLSATFRQGGYLQGKRGSIEANLKAIKAIADPEVTKQVNQRAVMGPNSNIYRDSKLFLSIKGTEEPFIESIAHKVPIVKQVIEGSERHYNTLLDLQRMNAMDDFIAANPGIGKEELARYAASINSVTGRGNLQSSDLLKGLTHVFYSPRFMGSRIGTVKHVVEAAFSPKSKASQAILKDFARFAGSRLAILSLGSAAGLWEMGKGADFGKVIIGGRSFDPWAGYLQGFRALAKLKDAENNYDINAVLGTYFGNKTAPNINLAKELLTGKDFGGKKTTRGASILRAVTPLNIQTGMQTYQQTKSVGKTAAAVATDSLGIGTGMQIKKKGSGSGASKSKVPGMPNLSGPPKMKLSLR